MTLCKCCLTAVILNQKHYLFAHWTLKYDFNFDIEIVWILIVLIEQMHQLNRYGYIFL